MLTLLFSVASDMQLGIFEFEKFGYEVLGFLIQAKFNMREDFKMAYHFWSKLFLKYIHPMFHDRPFFIDKSHIQVL